jgi:hypothetical protein
MRMRVRNLFLAAFLFAAATAQAGTIYYGRYTGGTNVSQFQIMQMDESGQNVTPLFPVGASTNTLLFSANARAADVSHASYNTSFAQGQMWLYVQQDGGANQLGDVHVFAKAPNGLLADRQVTDFVSSGVVGIDSTNCGNNTRWAQNDGFISCRVDNPGQGLSYLVRIAVTGAEIAADGFLPIPFFDPLNPGAINPKIEVLIQVAYNPSQGITYGLGHAWSPEGTRLAYYGPGGIQARTVGPLGTFTGTTDPTLDPIIAPTGTFSWWTDQVEWRPIAGSDQIIFYAIQHVHNGTQTGLFFGYVNSRTWALFLANGWNSKLKITNAYRYPTWSADGNTVVMMNGDWMWSNGPTYVCKVPAAGGTVVTLTSAADATAHLDLYGDR